MGITELVNVRKIQHALCIHNAETQNKRKEAIVKKTEAIHKQATGTHSSLWNHTRASLNCEKLEYEFLIFLTKYSISRRLQELGLQAGGNQILTKFLPLSHIQIGLLYDCLRLVQNHSLVFNLEPLHGIFLGNAVLNTDARLSSASPSNSVPWALKHDVEVHAVDTSGRVVPIRGKTKSD